MKVPSILGSNQNVIIYMSSLCGHIFKYHILVFSENMADITSDAMRAEEITDEGPYDPDLHHEFFIKEEEEETELRMEEEIKSEGDIAL